MDGIKPINNNKVSNINRIGPRGQRVQQSTKPGQSFQGVLERVQDQRGISLSKHARVRMMARDIRLDNEQVQRLSMAVERARQKGVRDTLVLMDDTAFVVNVKSTTVVTAAKSDTLRDRVFTNIDGAVIV